jgi:putative ABC transport system permease protein
VSARSKVPLSLLFAEGVRAVFRHKSRSALTVLGITIGIAAVVWVVAVGNAGEERTRELFRGLGDNLVWVEAGSRNAQGVRTGSHGTTTLTLDDEKAILREVPLIKSASPNIDGSLLIVYGDRNWTTRYRGISPEYIDIKRWQIAEGSSLTDEAVRGGANVCLIGQTVRERLFGSGSAVGETVRIGVYPFELVGVLARKGQSATGQDQDDTVMLPYTTAQTKFRGKGIPWLDDILCSAISAEAVHSAGVQITALLRQRHHIGVDDEDDFNIRRPETIIKAQQETSDTFAQLLLSVAVVALLVGGIGVMNVMLASVTERTREIGIRLAVGASEWAVQTQFLVEAVVLTFFGGLLGIAVSVAGAFVIGNVMGWAVSIPPKAFVLAVAFSVGVGVVFGFYPARLASRLDPIEALRRE